VQESGYLVKNPSIFLKKVAFVRKYEIRDGISVPRQVQSVVDTRLAGKAELTIDFSNFSIDAPNGRGRRRRRPVARPGARSTGDCMRTLFLNPPSFEGFDGGASSRWPASREIESYWYPVWLCYPAGMLPDSKVVDAPPHKISIEQTVEMAKDFELLVLFTSTPGFHVDVKMAEMMKDVNPKLKVAFVGPPVTTEPEKRCAATRPSISWCAASSITRSWTTPTASRSRSCPA
jgi:hypothetical protein